MNEYKISVITSGYKCDGEVQKSIDSVLDQDYPAHEIIVVLNGQWDTKGQLITALNEKYGSKVKVHAPTHGHLGAANNLGWSHATGDVGLFLSSDHYLHPGTLRVYNKELDAHPECAFIYSGYKLVSDDPTNVYYSCTFNRYHLECENYIDSANPVRREYVKAWDENLSSLQDWDWFLSVTDHGEKGHFIREPLFSAELPKRGGLSDDSSQNWIRRCKEIRHKHGIPDRTMCVASIGYKDFSIELAKVAGADFKIHPGYKPHEYRLVYVYGFPLDYDHMQASTSFFTGHYGHKVVHWTPMDIRGLVRLPWGEVDYYYQYVLSKIAHHWCFTLDSQSILSKIGMEPEIVYPPILEDTKGETIDAISVNDRSLLDELHKAMPDQTFHEDDPNCAISVHFDDRPDRVIQSITSGHMAFSNDRYPGVYPFEKFGNVPELRRMLVHYIRQARHKTLKQPEFGDWYVTHNPSKSGFRNKLERISEKPFRKYAKLSELTVNA